MFAPFLQNSRAVSQIAVYRRHGRIVQHPGGNIHKRFQKIVGTIGFVESPGINERFVVSVALPKFNGQGG
jgi:hypothetical protein